MVLIRPATSWHRLLLRLTLISGPYALLGGFSWSALWLPPDGKQSVIVGFAGMTTAMGIYCGVREVWRNLSVAVVEGRVLIAGCLRFGSESPTGVLIRNEHAHNFRTELMCGSRRLFLFRHCNSTSDRRQAIALAERLGVEAWVEKDGKQKRLRLPKLRARQNKNEVA